MTTDNGSEFSGKAMDAWAHQAGVKLDFIQPGRPVQNGLSISEIASGLKLATESVVDGDCSTL
jgi:transposase InsO family protein